MTNYLTKTITIYVALNLADQLLKKIENFELYFK